MFMKIPTCFSFSINLTLPYHTEVSWEIGRSKQENICEIISKERSAWVSNIDKRSSIGRNENINKRNFRLRFKRKASDKPYSLCYLLLCYSRISTYGAQAERCKLDEEKFNTDEPWFKTHRQPFGSLIVVTTGLLLTKCNLGLIQV